MKKLPTSKKELFFPTAPSTRHWTGGVLAAVFIALATWTFITGEYTGRSKFGIPFHLQGTTAYAAGVLFLGAAMFLASGIVTSQRYFNALLATGTTLFLAGIAAMLFLT